MNNKFMVIRRKVKNYTHICLFFYTLKQFAKIDKMETGLKLAKEKAGKMLVLTGYHVVVSKLGR